MEFLTNPVVVENISNIFTAGLIAFVIALLITPLVGALARTLEIVDLPANLRDRTDRSSSTRLHKNIMPRGGGLAISVALILTLIFFPIQDGTTNPEFVVDKLTIIIGIAVISIYGILDDKFEWSGTQQLIAQMMGAIVLIVGGITLPETITFLQLDIDLNSWSYVLEAFGYEFELILPNHILTLLWVVGITNIINWVGGIDGLNISVSSIISFTFLMIALSTGNIPLSILIAIHLGANLGLLPYNWNPAKIFPGAIGDCLNGFMIATFALLGDTRWTATVVILALPIIDAIIVLFLRFKNNKEVIRKPWKVLSLSDTNHLHHRLLEIGYTRKGVLFIEITIVATVSAITITLGLNDPNTETEISDRILTAFAIAMAFVITTFTIIYLAMARAKSAKQEVDPRDLIREEEKKAVVKVLFEDDEDEEREEKYYY